MHSHARRPGDRRPHRPRPPRRAGLDGPAPCRHHGRALRPRHRGRPRGRRSTATAAAPARPSGSTRSLRTMRALGDLEAAGGADVRFPCGTWHNAAARRLFLEACKHDPSTPAAPGPLEVTDSRTGQRISVAAGEHGCVPRARRRRDRGGAEPRPGDRAGDRQARAARPDRGRRDDRRVPLRPPPRRSSSGCSSAARRTSGSCSARRS